MPRPTSTGRGLLRQAETTSGAERQQHLQALSNVLAVDSVFTSS
jgi:DNA phosphorothioation-dependent restriction protein DptH